jgi:hypothetical protein
VTLSYSFLTKHAIRTSILYVADKELKNSCPYRMRIKMKIHRCGSQINKVSRKLGNMVSPELEIYMCGKKRNN